MATYDLANGDTFTTTPVQELRFDLARAVGYDDATARVMTEDLQEVLSLMAAMTDYIRRCASNDAEAADLLKRAGAST